MEWSTYAQVLIFFCDRESTFFKITGKRGQNSIYNLLFAYLYNLQHVDFFLDDVKCFNSSIKITLYTACAKVSNFSCSPPVLLLGSLDNFFKREFNSCDFLDS